MAVSLSGSEVVSQVATKLFNGFSKDIPTVCKDTPLQGMVKPCFFIQQLNTTQDKELHNRGDRTYFLDIHAHPTDTEDSKQTWCNKVGDKLFDVLDFITISNQTVYAQRMRFEIVDEVLHFFVEYSFKVIKLEEPGIKMENLDSKTHITTSYGKRR